tara:strand:+ start:302 stop:724 length:423 start_codon:yes stop_codon:yes gene_type:complete
MGPWWLYALMFIFGYLTHKTFYFLRATKISISLIRVSQLVSLAVLARSMENFYYSHTSRLRHMRESGQSEKAIKEARRSFNAEIKHYKKKAVEEILNLHPKFYDQIIDFDDWKTAMDYLENNKQFIFKLMDRDENDKENS